MRIEAKDMAGQVVACEAINYMAPGDRVAFEKHFHKSSAVMATWKELFDADAIAEAQAELDEAVAKHGASSQEADDAAKKLAKVSSEFAPGSDPGVIREEYDAFFAWRELRRHHPSLPAFDVWVDNLAELKVIGREAAQDPPTTAPAAPQT